MVDGPALKLFCHHTLNLLVAKHDVRKISDCRFQKVKDQVDKKFQAIWNEQRRSRETSTRQSLC